MELGYQSTECRGTIALEAETPGGLPPLHHHFFEFVEQDRWDAGQPEFLRPRTAGAGPAVLHSHHDRGRALSLLHERSRRGHGTLRETPLLRFVQKGRGVTSLTGEKLYEAQVIQAVQDAARRHRIAPSFFLLVAEEQSSSYSLFLETGDASGPSAAAVAADVDHRLGELNVEYHSKRASGRLAPLTIAWLRQGAGEAYKGACVRAGQREGQFKPAVLQYRKELVLSFEPYVIP